MLGVLTDFIEITNNINNLTFSENIASLKLIHCKINPIVSHCPALINNALSTQLIQLTLYYFIVLVSNNFNIKYTINKIQIYNNSLSNLSPVLTRHSHLGLVIKSPENNGCVKGSQTKAFT